MGRGPYSDLKAGGVGEDWSVTALDHSSNRRTCVAGWIDQPTALLFTAAPELFSAAEALIANVRKRYPGEDLKCPHMIALDKAVKAAKGE